MGNYECENFRNLDVYDLPNEYREVAAFLKYLFKKYKKKYPGLSHRYISSALGYKSPL